MNWDRVEGEWKQRRGKAMHHWGKLMNDDLAAIAGTYEELVGRLQEKYGIAKEEATQQIKNLRTITGKLKESNRKLTRLQKSLHRDGTAARRRISGHSQVVATARRQSGDGTQFHRRRKRKAVS